jgi:L(+)-tartrate dehydratase alpha subunit
MARAAIDIPADYRDGVRLARDREQQRLARFVLDQMLENWDIATAERRPMCADTGLPRYYVKLGNEALVEGGLVALERALRRATADATASVPLRPNRVHPLTR